MQKRTTSNLTEKQRNKSQLKFTTRNYSGLIGHKHPGTKNAYYRKSVNYVTLFKSYITFISSGVLNFIFPIH